MNEWWRQMQGNNDGDDACHCHHLGSSSVPIQVSLHKYSPPFPCLTLNPGAMSLTAMWQPNDDTTNVIIHCHQTNNAQPNKQQSKCSGPWPVLASLVAVLVLDVTISDVTYIIITWSQSQHTLFFSLISISTTMLMTRTEIKWHEVDTLTKNRIVGHALKTGNAAQAGCDENVNPHTAQCILKQYKKMGFTSNKPCLGHPQKLNDYNRCQILWTALKQCWAPFQVITNQISAHVSVSTVCNVLAQHSYHWQVGHWVPYLIPDWTGPESISCSLNKTIGGSSSQMSVMSTLAIIMNAFMWRGALMKNLMRDALSQPSISRLSMLWCGAVLLRGGKGHWLCLSIWEAEGEEWTPSATNSVAEVRFSPVQTPFCPNLNLNLLQNFQTWTEPELCIWFGFEPSEPCNFLESYFSIFFVSKCFETHVQTLKISYLCKAVSQTAFDKPNRYHTTDPNKHMCRKATQNMAISHHPGEALILYIKILKWLLITIVLN